MLRPGGRFAVSDVIADPDMDEATRADMAQWTGCIAGALTREEFETALADGRARRRSRSARRTASTSTRPRRSSARASLRGMSDEHPAQRPADALPPLGGLAVESVRGRPRCRTASSGPGFGQDEQGRSSYWRALVADGRRGADHDEVLGARRRLRERGGGDVPGDPAGRRGAAHAVLRALPGRGRRRPGDRSRRMSSAPASTSRRPSGRSSTRRSSQATSELVAG